ncbi:MAG: AsmA family protein [Gammaproteobacteria bacterium]
MSKILKYLGIGIGVLLLLFIVVAVIFTLTFDPNEYRDEISAQIEQRTGRKATIEGDLGVSIFPWLGFDVGRTYIANAEGFGDEPFAAFESASARVRLLPLLSRRVETGTVSLEGLALNLETDTRGRNNWDDLGTEPGDGSDEPATVADAQQGKGLGSLAIRSIEVTDASISYQNAQTNSSYQVRDWNLNTGRITPGEPFSVETDLTFSSSDGLNGEIGVDGELDIDLENERYALNSPKLALTTTNADGVSNSVDIGGTSIVLDKGQLTIDAPELKLALPVGDESVDATIAARRLTGNLENQTLSLEEATIDALGVTATAEIRGRNVFEEPQLSGSVAIQPFSLRDVLTRLGSAPDTTDPEVLKHLAISGKFGLGTEAIEFTDAVFVLDQTTARGRLSVDQFEKPRIRFGLNLDQIDLDRYLPPPAEGVSTDAAAPTSGTGDTNPFEALRGMDLDGEVAAEILTLAGIRSQQAKARLRIKNGRLRLRPATAQIFGGSYSGDIQLDASGQTVKLSIDEHVRNLDFSRLARELLQAPNADQLTGRITADVKLTGTGNEIGAIQRTLSGTAGFKMEDGAYEGTDLWYDIQQSLSRVNLAAAPTGPNAGRTEFEEVHGSAVIRNGVMYNDDLVMMLPFMQMTGAGTVDIPNGTIDYLLDATIEKSTEIDPRLNELAGHPIPVRISGPLTDPSIGPDVDTFAKRRIEQEIDKEKEKLKDKLEKKLEDKLKDLLGG